MMSNKILAFLLLFGSSLCAREIPQSNIVSLDSDVRVFHTKSGFSVLEDGKLRSVRSENVDRELRGITNKQLDLLLGNKAIVMVDGKEMEFTRIPVTFAKSFVAHNDSEAVKNSIAENILSQLPQQNHIKVIKYSNGEFGLRFKVNMVGGGVWGAIGGAWVGKIVVHGIFHGTVLVVSTAVSVVATPAVGYVVGATMESVLLPIVEPVSTAVALAGGIAGGVATGPV